MSHTHADDAANVVDQANAAVALEGDQLAAHNADVSLPSSGSDLAVLKGLEGLSLLVYLPAKGRGDRDGTTAVFDGTARHTQVLTQPTADGLRALITIERSAAPQRYTFPISGDVAELVGNKDGSVVALDATGQNIAALARPWARDAQGRNVWTDDELDGMMVTQVVKHRGGGYDYAITADLFWIPVAIALACCYTHPFCNWLVYTGRFRTAIDWARRHLF